MGRSRRAAPSRPSAPARAPPRQAAPAPAQQHPPAHPPQQGGIMSGMVSTIAQGFAFGTGSAVAHRAVGAVANSMGGSSEQAQPQTSTTEYSKSFSCDRDQENFFACLKENNGNAASCQFLYESLQSCQADARQFA